MKTKTELRAGMTFEECDAQRNYWKSMAQSGYCSGYPYQPYPPAPPPYTSPSVPSGSCPSTWYPGVVRESSGGGLYGSILGQDNLVHYFNAGYTQFYPNGQGVSVGESVSYAPFPAGNARAGKAACISSGY